jgi:hypothetical protein
MPGIETRAPERTDTSSGSFGSPSFLPVFPSTLWSAASVWSHIPGGNSRPEP